MGSFIPFSIGKRNLNKKNHWEQLDIKSYKITKPTVICLGGNYTKSPKNANAMCKLAQNLVGLKDKTFENEIATKNDIDFVGLDYGESIRGFNEPTHLTVQEQNYIAKNLFVSLCKDENGKILPNNQIIKNFNQITIFSWCHGSYEINNITTSAYYQMKDLGIDGNIAKQALNQMFNVSYSPNYSTNIPSLQIYSENDSHLENGTHEPISCYYFTNNLENENQENHHNAIFKSDEKTAVLITSNVLNPKKTLFSFPTVIKDEHNAFYINRNENWEPTETNISTCGDKTSQVAGYALASSIANSVQNQNSNTFTPKPTIDNIISDARSILEDTQTSAFYEIIKTIKEDQLLSTKGISENLTNSIEE